MVFYRCNLYELSGYQSQGNVKRHAAEHEMEDAQVHVPNFGGVENQAFIGVFDGHGGHEASKWCSQHLHEVLSIHLGNSSLFISILQHLQTYLTDRPHAGLEELLRQTFLDVDNVMSTLSFSESGTTAAVAVFCLESRSGNPPVRVLYCANAGDSRIVLCRNGRAERLSCLHKLDNPDERSRIENLTRPEVHSQIFTNQQGTERVLGFSLTRALGDHIMFAEYNTKDFIIGTPYTSRTILNDEDQFIILASDGVGLFVIANNIPHIAVGLGPCFRPGGRHTSLSCSCSGRYC